MTDFSDYIVYVDESGDHGLTSIDPEFPAFALSFCIFAKKDYTAKVVPAIQDFKFRYWGHDAVVLHEHEIRKSKGHFNFLMGNQEHRGRFQSDLTALIANTPFKIIGATIHKERLKSKYEEPDNPYEIALRACMEGLSPYLMEKGQGGKHVHLVFERRGKKEDEALELEFHRILGNYGQEGEDMVDFSAMKFEPIFAPKTINSTGLQLADLTARPMALQTLRPEQPNRAYDVIKTKLIGMAEFP